MTTSLHFSKASAEAKDLRKQAGAWLKQARNAAGLSQMDLAQRLGLKYYTFVSQVENGFGRVPTEQMGAWALALGLDGPQWLRSRLRTGVVVWADGRAEVVA